ncbi:hypothetical protein HNY73_015309 [Argiope bruennichi]|uniref:LisH domain-containing protein n=1 Tax=Argiope bruennichi TaxID=94029 RepID=A0A8T0EWE1_ARGBR|nr:hypothetical protein HNY73_015309 [Argiope bruennichi]
MEEMDTTDQSVATMDSAPSVNSVPETQNETPVAVEQIKKEKTEEEESNKKNDLNKTALMAVLQFLKKHNLQETEAILRRETKVTDDGKLPESAQNGSRCEQCTIHL